MTSKQTLAAAVLAVGATAAPPTAWAGNLQPSGINLGNTSFFDGFGNTKPGWAYLGYLQHGSFNRVVDSSGNDSPGFHDPDITATLWVNQINYSTGQTFFDGRARLGFNAILPVTRLRASFADSSPARLNAGGGIGDLTLGATLQFEPTIRDGRPVFSHRAEIGTIVPIGRYNETADMNPGANFWSLTPNWAATWLPTPRTEVSWRLNYIYNFSNSSPANLAPSVTKTKAGQAAWVNFTASYAVLPQLSVGLNGYYYHQLTGERYYYADGSVDSGLQFGDTGKSRVLAIGPGLQWRPTERDMLNVNLYIQTYARNRTRGKVLNVNWIHPF